MATPKKKDGSTISFFMRNDVVDMVNRMYEASGVRSRSVFVEEVMVNVAELGGLEKVRELRYKAK